MTKHTRNAHQRATRDRHADSADGADSKTQSSAKKPKPVESLVGLAIRNGTELFHTPDQCPYASIYHKGNRETYPIASSDILCLSGFESPCELASLDLPLVMRAAREHTRAKRWIRR